MDTYRIEILYYDKDDKQYYEVYNNSSGIDILSAIEKKIDRFHREHRPLLYEIRKIIIKKEIPFVMKPEDMVRF